MRRQILVVMALCGLAGCGGDDDQIDREQLVPQGMRRTVVTASDTHTTPAPVVPAPPPAPPVAELGEIPAGDDLVTHAPADTNRRPDVTTPADTTLAAAAPLPLDQPPLDQPPLDQAPTGQYVVQAGAYREQATAAGVAGKVEALGVATRLETVQTAGGTLHRVLVPGLADRPAAEALVLRLKQELGIDAAVRKP